MNQKKEKKRKEKHYSWWWQATKIAFIITRFFFRMYPNLDLSCDLSKAFHPNLVSGLPKSMYFQKYLLNNQFILLYFLDHALFSYEALVENKYQSSFPPSAGTLLLWKRNLVCFPVSPWWKYTKLRDSIEPDLHLNKFLQRILLTKILTKIFLTNLIKTSWSSVCSYVSL